MNTLSSITAVTHTWLSEEGGEIKWPISQYWYIRHGYCRRAYKTLMGSQSTSDLRIFGVQKPISDVKTPKTSTSASAADMFHIKGNILWLRTVTLTFPVCELSALDWIKKCFLPVVPLLCGIFKWNFTDMFHIKGYILWQRTITLTCPVHELSALDWSEKWFLTCSSFTIWNIWMKLHRYVEHQRLHIFSKDRHPYLSSSWVIRPWLIWKMVFDL